MLGLAEELATPYSVWCMRAPREHPQQRFAWFDLDWTRTPPVPNIDQARQALRLITDWLDSRPTKWIVAGFSQGAMMAGALLDRADAAWLMSGRFVPKLHTFEQVAGKMALVQHGTFDPVLPFEGGRELASSLESAGARVQFESYTIGHGVSPQEISDARAWLASLGPA